MRAYVIGGAVYATAGSQWSPAELQTLAAARGLSDTVGFTGHVDDVPAALRSLDIVVHASTEPEPFGMVIAEGMAARRAVVAARGGGAAELFDDRVSAVGYTPGDAAELAARLAELVVDAHAARRDRGHRTVDGDRPVLARAHGAGVSRGVRRMISIGLCVVAFLLCAYMGRKSLVAGICTLITVGYVYGIVRANLPDGFSHLIFDAGTLGLYAVQLGKAQPRWQHMRSEDIRNWLIVLIAWPVVLFAMPWQDPLIQLVGLRGSVFLLPFVLLGARLTGDDVYKLALWFSVLNLAAGALAVVEFTLGIEPFFPRNAVTDIIYRSKDLANYTAYRIPSSFGNAHAYAATMVLTMVAHCRRLGAGPPRQVAAAPDGRRAARLDGRRLHVGDAPQRADPVRADRDLDVHRPDQGRLSLPLAGPAGRGRLRRQRRRAAAALPHAAGSRVHRPAHRRQREHAASSTWFASIRSATVWAAAAPASRTSCRAASATSS